MLPPGRECDGAVVSLGYLTTPNDEQGVVEVSCEGCPCGPHGLVSSYRLYPLLLYSFPTINCYCLLQ